LAVAARAGVEALFVDPAPHDRAGQAGHAAGRAAYSDALVGALRAREVDLVCLSGFMRILSPGFIAAFQGRVLNIHPALLPAFPGAHAVRDALAWGVKVTGTTVHFADEQVDHGPVVAQECVPVLPADDDDTLHERIKAVEHRPDPVADVTGVPEMLEGRVKTLHPHIHAGILADRRKPQHLAQLKSQNIPLIDLVVCNLYPFRETVAAGAAEDSALEQIDVGGPAMV